MWRICLGWLVAIAIATGTAADAAAPITKIESRHWPDRKVTRRVLDQLAGSLVLQHYPNTGVRPKLPLIDLWFWTHPRVAETPSLCAIDEVTVLFAPAGQSAWRGHARSRQRHPGNDVLLVPRISGCARGGLE